MFNYPNQRKSYAEKIKNDFQWVKDVANSIIKFDGDYRSSSDYNRMKANYRLYNNIIDQEDLRKECNPLGLAVGQYEDEVKPYNKTYNKIQVLLGEEYKRPFNYRALLVNATGTRRKSREKKELIKKQLIAMFQEQVQPNNPDNELAPANNLEELQKYLDTEYLAAEEIKASQILKYLEKKNRIKEIKNDSFKHGLISGKEIVWTGIINGEPVVQIVNPLGFFYHKSPEVKYIQDGLYAGYRTRMTVGDIIDRYGDDLSNDQIEDLYDRFSSHDGIRDDLVGKEMKYHGLNKSFETRYYGEGLAKTNEDEGSYWDESHAYNRDVEVVHLEFRSERRIGFLTYIDEDGEEQMDIVDEDFPLPEGVQEIKYKDEYNNWVKQYDLGDGSYLEWDYIPEIWEATRIDNNIFVHMRPKPNQFRSIENPYDVKLGYHGVVYSSMNAPALSIMDRMRPYQYLYFLAMHKFKRIIARDKGKTMPIDTSMIDPEIGLEKTLYYLENLDYEIYNSLAQVDGENLDVNLAHSRGAKQVQDRSNVANILNYVRILESLEMMIGEAAGITRQREGQIQTYDTVGNTQQSVIQSSHITEPFFMVHDALWGEVLSSAVQTAQVAWQGKSVVKQYVLDDGSVNMLELNGELDNEDLGIFISNSAKDFETFNALKMLTQPLVQNDKIDVTDVIKILNAESPQELQRELAYATNKRMRQAQEAQQAQIQAEMESQKALQEDQQAHEKELHEMDNATKLQIAMMQQQNGDEGDEGEDDTPGYLDLKKYELEEKKVRLDQKNKEADRELKREEIAIKRKQANKPSSSSK